MRSTRGSLGTCAGFWRVLRWLLAGWLGWGAGWVMAAVPSEPEQIVVVVVGAGGTEDYQDRFLRWAEQWRRAAEQGNAEVLVVGPRDDPNGPSDRERLRHCLHELAQAPGSTPVWLVLIGHGTFDGRQAKFNLVGPDLAAADLAEWLAALERPVALIQTASASGPFLTACSDPNTVVVTATQSGAEQSATVFGGYLAAAIADPDADLDKDGQTSLLEACLWASDQAAGFYQGQGLLPTEHALLDDNGDGLGTPLDWFEGLRATQRPAEGAELDGLHAAQWCLVPGERQRRLSPEARRRCDELDRRIRRLVQQKETLAEAVYYQRLEALLLEMAQWINGTTAASSSDGEPSGPTGPVGSAGADPADTP